MIIPTNDSIINSKDFKDKIAKELKIYDQSTNKKNQMFKDSITKLFLYNYINEMFNSHQTGVSIIINKMNAKLSWKQSLIKNKQNK